MIPIKFEWSIERLWLFVCPLILCRLLIVAITILLVSEERAEVTLLIELVDQSTTLRYLPHVIAQSTVIQVINNVRQMFKSWFISLAKITPLLFRNVAVFER